MGTADGASTEQVLAPLPSGSEDKAWEGLTLDVLVEVLAERRRQVQQYGFNDDLETGMGPDVCWLLPYTADSAAEIEARLRIDYEDFEEDTGKPTWAHLLREELAEAICEPDAEKREAEWLQVAALAVSFVESSRRARGAS
jgi:hypothetical protein